MVCSVQWPQSAGPQKESSKHGGKRGKGKKKSFDTTQSSNPKLKYREKKDHRSAQALAEQTHKQKAPMIVSVVPEEEEEGEEGKEEIEAKGEEPVAVETTEELTEGDGVEESKEVAIAGESGGDGDHGDRGDHGDHEDDGDEGDQSDEEEKKILLAEENIHQLEEAEKVNIA